MLHFCSTVMRLIGMVHVAADRDAALARVKAVKLGGVGRSQRDEFWKIDAALADAFRKKERGPYLEAGNAIRHLFERSISAMLHLAFRILVTVAGEIDIGSLNGSSAIAAATSAGWRRGYARPGVPPNPATPS